MKQINTAGGLVISSGKVLLVRLRSGLFAIPKGHIEISETQEQAALREVAEETGVIAQIDSYLGKLTRGATEENGETVQKTIHIYKMLYVKKSGVKQEEITQWFELSDALNRMHFIEEAEFLRLRLEKLT